MNSIKSAVAFCFLNIRKWATNPRMYIIVILVCIIVYPPCNEIVELSRQLEYSVAPWLFSFLFDTQYFRFILLFGIVLMFCDAPFIDAQLPYVIIRSKKTHWMIGQILYIICSTFLYLLLILFLSVCYLSPNMRFEGDWGKIIDTLSMNGEPQFLTFSKTLISNYTPMWATIHTFLLNWAIGTVLGLLMFILNMLFKRTVGAIVAVGVILSSLMSYGAMDWVSPVILTRIGFLDTVGITDNPTLMYAYIFFAISISVLSCVSVLVSKTTEIQTLSSI